MCTNHIIHFLAPKTCLHEHNNANEIYIHLHCPVQAAVVEEVKKRGGEAAYGSGDVSSEADVGRLYEEATAYLGTEAPDVVVANAGVGRFGALEGVSAADYDLSFNTNVRGVFLWLRAVIPAMYALSMSL